MAGWGGVVGGFSVAHKSQTPDVERTAGFLSEIAKQARLVWQLMTDPHVPTWVKFIPPVALLYILSPIDLIPDPVLGLGQLDDLAVILIGLKLFIELSPSGIVQNYRDGVAGNTPPEPEGEVVDASYRVIEDE
jgi:uncharacterized membrane protein YkvA (DUF1232 family)